MNWAQLYESLGQQLKDGVDLPWWQDAFVGIYKAFFEESRWQLYLDGVLTTLWITAMALILGIVLGVVVAVIRTTHDQQRLGRHNPVLGVLNVICKIYVTIIRGTPMMVQLLIMGFVIFKSSRNHSMVGALALGINSGAYVAEIIRAGVQAVDSGQMEAARCLGLTGSQAMFKVVLPQAVRNILPALGNEFINMIKQVSLASVFFINELTTSYKTVLAATYIPIESILIAGMIYLLVTTVLSQVVNVMEWRMRLAEG